MNRRIDSAREPSARRPEVADDEIQGSVSRHYLGTDVDRFETSRGIADTSKGSRSFDADLRDVDRLPAQAHNQNEIPVTALQEAREQITALKEEVDKLGAPPSTYDVCLAANEDSTVTILPGGAR